jgi:hypothetical protein
MPTSEDQSFLMLLSETAGKTGRAEIDEAH